jgi:hypothetical protein
MSSLSKRLSSHLRVVLLLGATINVGMLAVHTVASNMYFRSTCIRMQMAAGIAVRAGAVYLPADPSAAVQVADAYATLNGVAPNEIVSTEVAANDQTLTIVLKRQLPTYVRLFVLGLPGEIKVTAQAQKHTPHLRTALYVRPRHRSLPPIVPSL